MVCGTFFHLCEQPFPDSTPAARRIHSHICDLTLIGRKIHSDVPLYDTRFLCHQKDRVGQTKRIQKAFSLHGCEKISASRDATFAASSAVMLRMILICFPFLLRLPAPCALFPPGTAGDIPGGVPPRSPFFPLCNTACQAQQPRRPAACSDVRAHRNAAP